MSIALLYERSENDENGIKLTAQQLGIDLTFIPFRKIALSISKDGFSAMTKGKDYSGIVENTKVVLNRAQSKNRHLHDVGCLAKKPSTHLKSNSSATANTAPYCIYSKKASQFPKPSSCPATPPTP